MSIANLAQDGRLIVKQRVEGFEAITGVETRNRYEVLTPEGQSVMLAYEESGGLGRVFLKRNRALTLHIAGLDGQDILVARARLLLAVPTDGRSGRHQETPGHNPPEVRAAKAEAGHRGRTGRDRR